MTRFITNIILRIFVTSHLIIGSGERIFLASTIGLWWIALCPLDVRGQRVASYITPETVKPALAENSATIHIRICCIQGFLLIRANHCAQGALWSCADRQTKGDRLVFVFSLRFSVFHRWWRWRVPSTEESVGALIFQRDRLDFERGAATTFFCRI